MELIPQHRSDVIKLPLKCLFVDQPGCRVQDRLQFSDDNACGTMRKWLLSIVDTTSILRGNGPVVLRCASNGAVIVGWISAASVILCKQLRVEYLSDMKVTQPSSLSKVTPRSPKSGG